MFSRETRRGERKRRMRQVCRVSDRTSGGFVQPYLTHSAAAADSLKPAPVRTGCVLVVPDEAEQRPPVFVSAKGAGM
ncbi:MAG: hypothetical protein DWQ34_05760 [Planctomycetota bacterium]|nr:MAG: hypothetical protein DWQ29_03950 [Planctomycetota bacterium]REJ95551.1 MAG: hypothetical protein DWQ34_05760 [Planctomycetota bacterium]REK21937.1 MAG: hypothetical protein DWQ41_20230 [Planctomycetota bacterium]REK32151.1 MAG: hypothetical protein DWQ45_17565 [Planctomycetota bacterium]